MFENYETMSDADKAQVKAIHKAIRTLPEGRYRNLAWGLVRGFPYRRIERTTRTQDNGDGTRTVHNRPSASAIVGVLVAILTAWPAPSPDEVKLWLASEAGAIPAPVRVKKPREAA
jgi:hypothetical protein